MALSVSGFLALIDNALDQLTANRENDVLTIKLDQIALIKARIQQQGLDYQGTAFPPYTPAYARTRKNAGYQVGYVDLTRTGATLASLIPVITESSIFAASATIEPGNAESAKIIRGLEVKRPGITVPTKDELRFSEEANGFRWRKYFNF